MPRMHIRHCCGDRVGDLGMCIEDGELLVGELPGQETPLSIAAPARHVQDTEDL